MVCTELNKDEYQKWEIVFDLPPKNIYGVTTSVYVIAKDYDTAIKAAKEIHPDYYPFLKEIKKSCFYTNLIIVF